MNFKPSIALLLSLMLCSAHVTAHDFSANKVLDIYIARSDFNLACLMLSKLNFKQIVQLENDILALQTQEIEEDYRPLLAAVKKYKHNMSRGLRRLAMFPFVYFTVMACFAKERDEKVAWLGAGALGSIPALAYVRHKLGLEKPLLVAFKQLLP